MFSLEGERVMARQICRRQFIRFSAMSVGAAMLVSCVPAAPAGTSASEPAAASTTAPSSTGSGTLVVGYPQKTTYGNFCQPWFYAGTQDLYQRRLTYSGLVQWNNDYSDFLPDLAESWEFDGNQAIFHLRQDVKWHDGEPFTADDVIFTYQI